MRYLLFLTFAAAFIAVIACAKPIANASNTTIAANGSVPAATPPPPPVATPDDAPRITLADAKKAFDEGNAYIVDARAESVYKDEHIKGAVNIPSGTLDDHLKELPTNKKIIVYCS